MSDTNALFPLVQSQIDFETLLLHARDVLDDVAHDSWSNLDEHDPGLTILQALCYNISDLAYRSSLPINDLLTPAPALQKPDDGLFPTQFGPHQALTCGPITVEDYRRALLDLHDGSPTGHFYFDNVQLLHEPLAAQYTYWYNQELREYSFNAPEEATDAVKLTLTGNYHLYVQPSRTTAVDPRQAQAALDIFLRDHRNLCEAVSQIIWVKPADVMVKAVIELKDEVDTSKRTGAILAQIYTALEEHVTPPVVRYSTQQLQDLGRTSEQIYDGPLLQHGWIPQLPAAPDYTQPTPRNLARAVNRLQEIEEIASIRLLSADAGGNTWEWTTPAECYARLWGANPLAVLAEGDLVQLIYRGVTVKAEVDDILPHLTTPPLIQNPLVTLPYAQWRAPARYFPATGHMPPCYGLLQAPTSVVEQQLHEFLLAFEQLLANGCQQLALLPQLLSFNRQMKDVTWGVQWPFAPGSVSDAALKHCASDLKAYLQQYSHDTPQELAYVDYLLGYFNEKVSPENHLIDQAEFLATQQGYLGHVAQLAYQRTNLRTDQVSALQQRIASRLGIGGLELFNGQTPLDQLPFYLVEHRGLLPTVPNPAYEGEQTPLRREKETFDGVEYLTLTLPASAVEPLHIGQVVDIIVKTGSTLLVTIRALMIERLYASGPQGTQQHFCIRIASNVQLQRNLTRVLDPANTVTWKNCDTWLEDMYYPVVYAQTQTGLEADERRLVSSAQSPYPAMVGVGDMIIFAENYLSAATALHSEKEEDPYYCKAEVISFDHVTSTLVVKAVEGNFPPTALMKYFYWYFDSELTSMDDRFSFLVSAVFSRNLLTQLTSDPYAADTWIVNTILEELPAHINLLMHCLPHDQYLNFGATYKAWQNHGAPLGDASYSLMRTLTIGCLPSTLTGVGAMVIATPEQRERVVGTSGQDWDRDVIINEELLFVPVDIWGEP